MISMRYLIVSLAAVFLALGIGIFIGFMFDGQEIFLNQQEALIDELEYKFGEIRIENEGLHETINIKDRQISYYESFVSNVFPKLIQSKLIGMNIAIIETNEDYNYNQLISTIENANGEVSSITYIKNGFANIEKRKMEEIYQYFSEFKGITIDRDKFPVFLSDYLVQAILEQDKDTLQLLRNNDLIELRGDFSKNIDCFIIAGGSAREEYEELIEMIDIPIIKRIKQYNMPVVGVERSEVKISSMDDYKRQKISTVDNIDTLMGQYSLAEVILGNNGNYGIKPSADNFMPE